MDSGSLALNQECVRWPYDRAQLRKRRRSGTIAPRCAKWCSSSCTSDKMPRPWTAAILYSYPSLLQVYWLRRTLKCEPLLALVDEQFDALAVGTPSVCLPCPPPHNFNEPSRLPSRSRHWSENSNSFSATEPHPGQDQRQQQKLRP